LVIELDELRKAESRLVLEGRGEVSWPHGC
jgi:hypothetical protein